MRRSEFESLLKQRRVLVDGKQRTDAYELSGGETIVITPPPPDEKPTINALEAPQGAKGAAASVPSQPLPKSPANSGITNTGSTQAAAAARVASPPLQKPAGDLIAADAGARTTKPAGASGKIGDEDRMNVSSTPEIVIVGPSERPLLVDPTSVGCGFVLIANKYLPFFEDPSRAHKALETNKTKLWEAVRRHEPDKKVLFLVSNQHIPDLVNALAYAFKALDGSGKYPGYSMTIDSMAISPDGGRTLVEFYVGLNWKSSRRELVLAGPQGILPGKL
jgi:hypothetical protein